MQHRLAVAIVAAALAATAVVFLFARPEYHQPGGGKTVKGTAYPAAINASGARGWTWSGGQPGFAEPLSGHEDWNISEVAEHELDGARFDAHLTPVRPETVRLLAANRVGPRDLELLLSGTDQQGATCIGAELSGHARFFCPSSAGTHRLGDQVAFVVVAAKPSFRSRGDRGFPMFVEAATRGDVTRVAWSAPSVETFVHRDGTQAVKAGNYGQEAYHRKNWGWWGTFAYTSTNSYLRGAPRRPWRARLDFYGDHGLLATLNVRLDRPVERLFAVNP